MTTTPPELPDRSGTHATGPAPASAPAALFCPECRELVRTVPPAEWPLAGWAPRPAHSHFDGTALCPVPGPGGLGPAEPVTAPARLTVWQAVRQSWLIHPEWRLTEHLAWLDEEEYDLEVLHDDPAKVVAGWLSGHRRAARNTPPGQPLPDPADPADPADQPPRVVYVVAGGSMVAAFADETSAGVQHDVMILAGLDPVAFRLTWARWMQVRAELRTLGPEAEIIEVGCGEPS